MDVLLEYLKLYTVNEITLSSSEIKFDKYKKYVVGIFINNNLINLFINYKFKQLINCERYDFNFNYDIYSFYINDDNIKTNIFELACDFNDSHFADLLSTHYNKKNTQDINNIYVCYERRQACDYININEYNNPTTYKTNFIKLNLINNKIN